MQRSIKRLFDRQHNPHKRQCHRHRCRQWLALGGLSLGLCMPAIATDTSVQKGLNGLVSAGLTMGGESVLTMDYTNGETAHVRGGNFIQLGIGAQWRLESAPLALALTANYHVDQSAASNGFGEFVRYPLEAILYYVGEDWRFGVGARRVLLPEARAKNDDGTYDLRFQFSDANGTIVEAGYAATESLWLNFRVVREEYRAHTATFQGVKYDARPLKFDGSHIGINFAYIF